MEETKENIIIKLGVGRKYKKIAGFDLDHTIIKTKSGNTFPKNADDWKFFNEKVEDKINDLLKKRYRVIIFTNQCNLDKKEKKYNDFMKKIDVISDKFDNKIDIIVSLRKDKYRKPELGMWELVNGDVEKSFYVGDAAGRKNDFSDSDLKFAENIGIDFYLPEDFFK